MCLSVKLGGSSFPVLYDCLSIAMGGEIFTTRKFCFIRVQVWPHKENIVFGFKQYAITNLPNETIEMILFLAVDWPRLTSKPSKNSTETDVILSQTCSRFNGILKRDKEALLPHIHMKFPDLKWNLGWLVHLLNQFASNKGW